MTTLWDGAVPTSEQLEFLGLSSYGCYTFMQVRRKSVRGLALHLERLRANGQELFGVAPEEDTLRDLLERAVTEKPCSLRVTLVSQDVQAVLGGQPVRPEVVVTTSLPKDTSSDPISVRTVPYARETPWIKHRGTYGLARHTRAAHQAGFDDALFVGSDGALSEGTTWNLLLRSEDTWIWPEAEVLNGVTMRLLARAMKGAGAEQVRRPVPAGDLRNVQAFALNASSHARPIIGIDEHHPTGDASAAVQLEELWQSIAAEEL